MPGELSRRERERERERGDDGLPHNIFPPRLSCNLSQRAGSPTEGKLDYRAS